MGAKKKTVKKTPAKKLAQPTQPTQPKRGRGQPPKPPEKKRGERLSLALSRAELDQSIKAAKAAGVRLSQFVRGAVLREIDRVLHRPDGLDP